MAFGLSRGSVTKYRSWAGIGFGLRSGPVLMVKGEIGLRQYGVVLMVRGRFWMGLRPIRLLAIGIFSEDRGKLKTGAVPD